MTPYLTPVLGVLLVEAIAIIGALLVIKFYGKGEFIDVFVSTQIALLFFIAMML
jgi:hypothetical protein